MPQALVNGDDALDPVALGQFLREGGSPSDPFSYFSGLFALGIEGSLLRANGQEASTRLFGSPALPGEQNASNEISELSPQTSELVLNGKHLFTPLHLASMAGNRACIQLLLRHGADITRKDAKGRTARDTAHPSVLDMWADASQNRNSAMSGSRDSNPTASLNRHPQSSDHPTGYNSARSSCVPASPTATGPSSTAPGVVPREIAPRSAHAQNETRRKPDTSSSNAHKPLGILVLPVEVHTTIFESVVGVFRDSNVEYPSELALEVYAFLVMAARDRSSLMVPARTLQKAIDTLLTVNWALGLDLEGMATGVHIERNSAAQTLLLWRAIELQELVDICPNDLNTSKASAQGESEAQYHVSLMALNEYLVASGKSPVRDLPPYDDCAAWSLRPCPVYSMIYYSLPDLEEEEACVDTRPTVTSRYPKERGVDDYPQAYEVGDYQDCGSEETFPGASPVNQGRAVQGTLTHTDRTVLPVRLDILTPTLVVRFYDIYSPDRKADVSRALGNGTCSLKALCSAAQNEYSAEWREFIENNIQPAFDQLARDGDELVEMARELDELSDSEKESIVSRLETGLCQLREWGARESSVRARDDLTEIDHLLERFLTVCELIAGELLPNSDN